MQVAEGFTPSLSPLLSPFRRRAQSDSSPPLAQQQDSSQLTSPPKSGALRQRGGDASSFRDSADAMPQFATKEASLGFVQQHDVLMPTLTVTETILLGMMFRDHVKQSETQDAADTVSALLSDLGLQSAHPMHVDNCVSASRRLCCCSGHSAALLVCLLGLQPHVAHWPDALSSALQP